MHEKQLKKVGARARFYGFDDQETPAFDLVPEKMRATLLAGGAGKKSGKKAAKESGL